MNKKMILNGQPITVSGGAANISAGDGLSKDGDTLNVTTPVRNILTQEEFDALSDEEKNNGLYVIKNSSFSGKSIDDYTTDDGWHVRKWSDGYIEMTVDVVLSFGTPRLWGDTIYVQEKFMGTDLIYFPVELVEKYSEIASVRSVSSFILVSIADGSLTRTGAYGIGRPNVVSNASANISIFVTGRWK